MHHSSFAVSPAPIPSSNEVPIESEIVENSEESSESDGEKSEKKTILTKTVNKLFEKVSLDDANLTLTNTTTENNHLSGGTKKAKKFSVIMKPHLKTLLAKTARISLEDSDSSDDSREWNRSYTNDSLHGNKKDDVEDIVYEDSSGSEKSASEVVTQLRIPFSSAEKTKKTDPNTALDASKEFVDGVINKKIKFASVVDKIVIQNNPNPSNNNTVGVNSNSNNNSNIRGNNDDSDLYAQSLAMLSGGGASDILNRNSVLRKFVSNRPQSTQKVIRENSTSNSNGNGNSVSHRNLGASSNSNGENITNTNNSNNSNNNSNSSAFFRPRILENTIKTNSNTTSNSNNLDIKAMLAVGMEDASSDSDDDNAINNMNNAKNNIGNYNMKKKTVIGNSGSNSSNSVKDRMSSMTRLMIDRIKQKERENAIEEEEEGEVIEREIERKNKDMSQYHNLTSDDDDDE